MNKYGLTAVKTVELLYLTKVTKPLDAWNTVSTEIFGAGTWSQRKGCPKNAFLGLCEAGLIRGINEGRCSENSGSQKNKNYAIEAVEILRSRPELVDDKHGLWRVVMNGVKKSHNSQMDVVLSLWNNNLIISE
ncbi:hypothetical protein FHS16_004560 [Paenibacillus endophyticus]|uniref:Uncharacterized protein n=1 Tax=Paenibacillus endophyticus TaxID=1294268 RepID=A0A7W5GCH4_9BACL|nr:hypothetical protein [Paenibacillus endophyticus]MBB3154478.1 hypothetical protein [Paenibacillus endophyticus]